MIFIWGLAVLAILVFLPLAVITVLVDTVGVLRTLFGKDDDEPNNGYCRDLQREIASERKHNASPY